jgi:hypothetical protein
MISVLTINFLDYSIFYSAYSTDNTKIPINNSVPPHLLIPLPRGGEESGEGIVIPELRSGFLSSTQGVPAILVAAASQSMGEESGERGLLFLILYAALS